MLSEKPQTSQACECQPAMQKTLATRSERLQAALLGSVIGDAHAAPLHWYYSKDVLKEHIKQFYCDSDKMIYFHKPAELFHPDSWKYFSKLPAQEFHGHIIHTPLHFWQTPGTPYHCTLEKGQCTVSGHIVQLLAQSLIAKNGCYDPHDYLQRYIEFFETPNKNPDLYIEGMHRHFFKQLKEHGKQPNQCGLENETCASGMVFCLALILFFGAQSTTMLFDTSFLQEHTMLSHVSEEMVSINKLLAKLLVSLLHTLSEDNDNNCSAVLESIGNSSSVSSSPLHAVKMKNHLSDSFDSFQKNFLYNNSLHLPAILEEASLKHLSDDQVFDLFEFSIS